jgi:plasmid maintenance system antidote protein VapI
MLPALALSRVLNSRAATSADMAGRLEAWLDEPERGPSAESWLRQPRDFDLWQAEQQPRLKVAVVHRRAA